MGIIISSIKNKIQSSVQNKEREKIIKKWVTNIGEIVEEEDRIVCYVKQDLLIDECRNSISGCLNIDGLFRNDNYYIEYLNRLNLDKPVYYIFDGINFEWWFKFSSKWNCNVIFKNCTFRKGIFIMGVNNVTFENNIYYDYYNSNLRCGDYFDGKKIGKITFINENFVNNGVSGYPAKFGINLNADLLEIINTHIRCGSFGDVNICANELIIKNSNIDTHQLKMNVNKIDYVNSCIEAKKRVVIENNSADYIGNIHTPMVVYNGVTVMPINGILDDVNDVNQLNHARIELVLKLYQISKLCQRIEDRKIQNARKMLNEQSIGIISNNDDVRNKHREELLKQSRIELIKKLSDIRDYYQLLSDEKVDNIRNNFGNQSISKVLKRDDLGF